MKVDETLPRTLISSAKKIRKHYKSKKYRIKELFPVHEDIGYKIHFIFSKGYEKIAIEVREKCDIQPHFKSFIDGCHSMRVPIKIYFAVPEKIGEDYTTITHAQREELEKKGIGLLIIKENEIKEDLGTIPCNRKLALDSTHRFPNYKEKVLSLLSNYNKGNCLNALRDLSELVEEATMKLAIKAAKKSIINVDPKKIEEKKLNWDTVINILSLPNYNNTPQTKILDKTVSSSLTSFKDVRNLGDHWKTKKEKEQIEEKYPVSMMQGLDLLRDLNKLIKKS